MVRIALCLIAAIGLAACSQKSSTQTNTTTTAMATTQPGTSEVAPGGPGTMHVTLTGASNVNADYPLRECMIRKPGKNLADGLTIVGAEGAPSVQVKQAQVNLWGYTGDKTYTIAPTHEYVGPVTVLFRSRMSIVEKPDSSTVVSVKDGGKSGIATFKNWHVLFAPGTVSGTITWQCGKIIRPAI